MTQIRDYLTSVGHLRTAIEDRINTVPQEQQGDLVDFLQRPDNDIADANLCAGADECLARIEAEVSDFNLLVSGRALESAKALKNDIGPKDTRQWATVLHIGPETEAALAEAQNVIATEMTMFGTVSPGAAGAVARPLNRAIDGVRLRVADDPFDHDGEHFLLLVQVTGRQEMESIRLTTQEFATLIVRNQGEHEGVERMCRYVALFINQHLQGRIPAGD